MAPAEPNENQAARGDLPGMFGSHYWEADSDASDKLGALLAELAEDPFLRNVAIRSLRQMRLALGQRVLDAGCGTGVLLTALAEAVGPNGQVVGLDHNPTFLAEARERVGTTDMADRIALREGDVLSLPFANGSFDASHCERVLMHLEDPARAVAELARVTRPGGWVVVAEPDYGSLRTDHPDQEAIGEISAASIARFRSPLVGMEAFRLMADAGLVERSLEVLVEVETVLHPLGLASYQYGAETAVANSKLTRERADAALAVIRDADDRGVYAAYAHMCVVAGQVADPR